MGVGKTAIGSRLAIRLGYHFLDSDAQIEKNNQCTISEIFKNKGESYFRQLETQFLESLREVNNSVIATGGGALTIPGNLEILKDCGKLIYLNVDLEKIIERIMRNKRRPLVQTENPIETIKELYEKRKHLYEQADIIINTGSMGQQRIVSEIIRNI